MEKQFETGALSPVIERALPELMQELAAALGAKIMEELKQQIVCWRSGDIKTLQEVYEAIRINGFAAHTTCCRQVTARWSEKTLGEPVFCDGMYGKITDVILHRFEQHIATVFFGTLCAMGPVGFSIIVLVVGNALPRFIVTSDIESVRIRFTEKVSSMELPQAFRRCITDTKIDQLLSANEMEKIKQTLCDRYFTEAMAEHIQTARSARGEKR